MEKLNKGVVFDKGITLIALVVTIIVLLILAGVSIATLTGDSGILRQAGKAKEQTEIASEKEQIQLAYINGEIVASNEDISESIFEKNLEEYFGKNNANVIGPHEEGILIKIQNSNRIYLLNGEKVEGPLDNIDLSVIGIYNETPTNLQGTGTLGDSWKINCIEDLVVFSNKMRNGATYSGDVELTKDLNFKSATSYNNYKTKDFGDINGNGKIEELMTELTTNAGFLPIIFDARSKSLKLNFNGNGHQISNLYIDRAENVGLFGKITDAPNEIVKISNLTITGKVISSENYAGGLIGLAGGSSEGRIKLSLSNICNKVNVIGKVGAGGIIGSTYIDPEIYMNFCSNEGIISSEQAVGGLIGGRKWDGSYSGFYDIKNSYSIGTLNAKNVGGLVYSNGNRGTVKVNITNSYSFNELQNVAYAGGIVYEISCRDASDLNSGNFINVCNFNNLNGINNIKGILYTSGNTIEQQYVYYPNTIAQATPDDTVNTGAIPMDIEEMLTKNFMDDLNKNIEKLNISNLAKWTIGNNGKPTLDFNIIWNGIEWIKID